MTITDLRGIAVSSTDPPQQTGPNPGLAIKQACRVATTANIVLSGLQTIDGVALNANDRVLVWQQTDQTTNGIYNASTGGWTRSIDANSNALWASGMLVEVNLGTLYASNSFQVTTLDPIVLGTSLVTFIAAHPVPTSRNVNTTAPLTGGGALSSDKTLSLTINSSLQVTGGALAVAALGAVSHKWVSSINASGVPQLTQPAFTDISGSVAATQMPALTGDVTSSAGSVATTIAANVVTNAKAAQMGANTIKGNNTGGSANAADLTVAQTQALLGIGNQMPGTTTNDNASAGNVGEFVYANTPDANATVTISIASPAVITWTGHPFINVTASGVAAVTFTTTGALPTGLTASTVYYVVPGSITTNTFQVATSIANALAGTAVNTSGSQSGTQTGTGNIALATSTPVNVAAISLTAGDWDVSASVGFTGGGTTTITFALGLITTTSATAAIPAANMERINLQIPNGATLFAGSSLFALPVGPTRLSLSATTTVYLVCNQSFGTSTMAATGALSARRRR
jgi:hypothetical protein